jgi:hypothetical protein
LFTRGWTSYEFNVVKVYDARDEVIVRSSNFLICKAAFEKALFAYPKDHLEMRQGPQSHWLRSALDRLLTILGRRCFSGGAANTECERVGIHIVREPCKCTRPRRRH